MSKHVLFDKEIEFSKANDRYYKMFRVCQKATDGAEETFINFYKNSSGISDVLDSYSDFLYTTSLNIAIEPLFKVLLDLEIYDISRETFEDACWDLSAAEPYYDCIAEKYNEIVEEEEEARSYRAMRKATRGKWVGGGFGIGGAIKGAVTAGAMNAVTGLGHSAVNAIGNIGSSAKSITAQVELYDDERTLRVLINGVRETIADIFSLFMEFVNEYKQNEGEDIWYDGNIYDFEKADTLYKNSSLVKEKEKELLFKAVSICPYHYNLLCSIFLTYEEERENIFNIAQFYKLDFSPFFNILIMSMYDEKARKSNSAAYEARIKIKDFMAKYKIEDNDTLNELEQDCLTRISKEYEHLLPEEATEFLDKFVNFDASDRNKSIIIEKFLIWELFNKYGVKCSKPTKELIIDKYISLAKKRNVDFETIIDTSQKIIKTLHFTQSDILDIYQYSIISNIAKDYNNITFNETENIVNKIRNLNISQHIKEQYVYKNNIWELFKEYDIKLSENDIIQLLYTCYEKMNIQKLSDDIQEKSLIQIISELTSYEGNVVISTSKPDTYLFNKITKKIKVLFEKANIYGNNTKEYYSIGFFSDRKYNIENNVWGFGDEGFENLLDELWNNLPKNEKDIIKENIVLIFAEKADSGRKLYTFFDKEKIYTMKQGNPAYFLTLDDIKYVGSNGLISLKNDNTLVKVFSSDDRSNAECENIANAIYESAVNIRKIVENNEKTIKQLKAYYNYVKKTSTGENVAKPSLFKKSTNSKTASSEHTNSTTVSNDKIASEQASAISSPNKPNNNSNNNNKPKKSSTKDTYKASNPLNNISSMTADELQAKLMSIKTKNCCNKFYELNTPKFISKLPKAISAYAMLSNDERPLVMDDATVFGSAKEGFVLTNKRIYIKQSFSSKECIHIKDVSNIIAEKNSSSSSSLTYVYLIANNTKHQIYFASDATEAEQCKNYIFELITLLKYVSSEPQYSPQANNWVCSCGNTNTGKFCTKCGSPKNN